MIVDVHTRLWQSTEQLGELTDEVHRRRPEPWNRPDASVQSHENAIEAVDAAILHGLKINRLGAAIPARLIADCVKRQPDHILGFVGLDATDKDALKQLDEAIELGLVGVTINPAAQGYHPADTRVMAIYEACAAKGMPIFIDQRGLLVRGAEMSFASPVLFDEALREFDGLTLVFSSLATPFTQECLAMMMKHERVFADVADLLSRQWGLYDALVRAYQIGAINRLLFGSGFPFATPQQAMLTLYSVSSLAKGTQLPTVPREQLRSIVEHNALTSLGLSEKLKVKNTAVTRPIDPQEPDA